MTDISHPILPELISPVLGMFSSKMRRRGEDYIRNGAVRKMEILAPGVHYVVQVQGGELYHVDVVLDEGEWYADCDCPYEDEFCKHAYAALWTLRAVAEGAIKAAPDKPRAGKKKAPAKPAKPSGASPLLGAFEKAKGKPASQREKDYLGRVTSLFEELHERREHPHTTNLEALGVFSSMRVWGRVRIWEEFPADDHEFWLFVLNYQREFGQQTPRYGKPIPKFMDRVGDLAPIAKKLERLQRLREVEEWRDYFEGEGAGAATSMDFATGETSELRLRLRPQYAALEIRREGSEGFRLLGMPEFRAVTDRYASSRTAFDPRSELLLRRMDHLVGGSSHRLRRENFQDMRTLHGILNTPSLREAVVAEDGEPFEWREEKLVWNVSETGEDDERLRVGIAQENGQPVSRIDFALTGAPGYYVVGHCIHEGPPFDSHRLNPMKAAVLPRAALETSAALTFFHHVGARLPEEFVRRIDAVELRPQIVCRLRRNYGEECELIARSVDDDGKVVETWTKDGWLAESWEPDSGKAPERVRVHGRSKLSCIPGVFDMIGAAHSWGKGLSVAVNKTFPKRFCEWLESLPKDVEVVLEGELAAFNQPATAGSLSLEIEPSGIDWFDLKVELDIADEDLTQEEIDLLLNAKGDWVRLDDKGWRRLAFELSEEDLYCEIEGEQRKLYDAERKRARQLLLGVKTQKQLNKLRFNFLTSLLRLRQICCHPKLVREASRAKAAKLESLIELAEPLMEEGVKLLVFSQFVEALDLIEAELKKQEWPIWKLTGSTENRGALVDDFQAHEGAGIFLISLKAGGAGLNLTAASYVVLFDPWWNPAVENQAIDRTHRIGQTDKVIAYRLLIKNTVEEKIRELQKQALAEDVLGEEKFSQSLTVEDFQFLLED